MRDLAVAVTTLTRVRAPGRLLAGGSPARSTLWFPLVGTGIGLVTGGVLVGSAWLTGSAWVAAGLAVAVEVVLTGALHLDGLADSADGLAGRTREQRLAIMKDHATGVYGVAAVVLDLLLKAACLGALAASGTGDARTVLLLGGCYTVSRTAFLPLARALPYARAEGTGKAVIEGLTTRRLVAALGLALGLVVVLTAPSWLAASRMILAGAVAAGLVGLAARARLGGVTGDVLGATAELSLLATLVAAVR